MLAALVAGIALAASIARDAEASADVVVWGALFLGLYLVAHVAVRRTVPDADGALLPLTAVLTAFGLANYRLDPDEEDARRCGSRSASASSSRRSSGFATTTASSSRTATSSASRRSRCSCSRLCLAWARASTA